MRYKLCRLLLLPDLTGRSRRRLCLESAGKKREQGSGRFELATYGCGRSFCLMHIGRGQEWLV